MLYEVIEGFRMRFENGDWINYPVGKKLELNYNCGRLLDEYNVTINEKYVKRVDDGWIPYNGQTQPVADNAKILVKYMHYNGYIEEIGLLGKDVNWGGVTSVLAYKIIDSLDKNVEAVRDLLKNRAETGFKKYGVTTERNDLKSSEWCQHAIEELLDCAVYLTRLKEDLKTIETLSKELK